MDETPRNASWLDKYGPLSALAVVAVALTPTLGWWRALIAGLATLVIWSILVGVVRRSKGEASAEPKPVAAEDAAPTNRDSDAAPLAPGDPPELIPAIEALQAERHADVLRLVSPYLESADPSIQVDALRLAALAHSHSGDYERAVSFWARLAKMDDSSHTWLNVATSHAMAGEFDKADAAFERMQQRYAAERGAPPGARPIQPMAVANYVQSLDMAGRPDLAVPHLETLAGFYRSARSTDSHFLFMHGMPFFSTFLEKSLPILRKVKDEEALARWYRPIHEDVDEDGKAQFLRLGVPH